MTYRIINNKKSTSVFVLFTANSTLTIAGNTSVSNVAIDNEELSGAVIQRAWCGTSSGDGAYWTVKRGANTVAVFDSTAFIDYAGNGLVLGLDSSATLSANINGSVLTGTLILELKKIGINGDSGPIYLSDSDYERA